MAGRGTSEAALQDALQRLGAKRVEATLLAALVLGGAHGTREIVEKTGLRQPEVSVGMQMLRQRDWVDAESVPRQGKGRPMHRYELTTDTKAIRQFYEEHGKKEMERYQEAIATLKKSLG